jgi:phosphatidylglycerophosphate synthase
MKGQFALALLFLAVNRLADGLDGAVARRHGATDLGGYLDITADFLLWALLPLGFMLHSPDTAFAAAILLSSFAMSMTVFLAFAVMAEKRGASSTAQGKKSFFYLAGLAEGTETIAFFAFVMVYPMYFTPAALIFAAIVYISVLGRLMVSVQQLKEPKNG